jgi:hypothetical protein
VNQIKDLVRAYERSFMRLYLYKTFLFAGAVASLSKSTMSRAPPPSYKIDAVYHQSRVARAPHRPMVSTYFIHGQSCPVYRPLISYIGVLTPMQLAAN